MVSGRVRGWVRLAADRGRLVRGGDGSFTSRGTDSRSGQSKTRSSIALMCVVAGVLVLAGGGSAATVTVLQAAHSFPVLDEPYGEAFDGAGDLFVSNVASNSVTVLPAASGTLFGQSVTANDDATLTAASGLDDPYSLQFDSAGDLFIANYGNNTVTVVPKATGTLFGQSVTANTATTLNAASGLDGPVALVFDSAGNLYIANWKNSTVTVVPKATGTLFGQSVTANTATALTAASGLDSPSGMTFDSAGDLLITNFGNNTVTVVPKATGTLFGQSVTANTSATLSAATGLNAPYGIGFDSAGNLYLANIGGTVRVVPKATGTVFGQSVSANTAVTLTAATTSSSSTEGYTGLLFGGGSMYIADFYTNAVTVVPNATGTVFGQSVTANVATTLNGLSDLLDEPAFETYDSAGDLFIANQADNTVTVIPNTTGTLFGQSVIAGVPVILSAATGLDGPNGITFDSAGNLYIADNQNNTMTVLPKATGTVFGQSVTANTATTLTAASGLSNPAGIKFDSAGDLLIANDGNSTVTVVPKATGSLFGQAVTANTAVTLTAATGLDGPYALGFDSAGDLYIVNDSNNLLTVVPKATGTLFGQAVTANTAATLTAATGLNDAGGIAFDGAGDMYIANFYANDVLVVPAATGSLFGQSVTANTATTLAGANTVAGVNEPNDVAFDPAGGLILADFGGNSISDVQATPAAPAAPSATATGTSGQVSVSWTAPANGDATITSYTVTPTPACTACSGLTVTGNPAASSTTIGGLTGGTAYTFTVTATNTVGTSASSVASNAATPAATAPSAPTGVSAVAGSASATVSFTAPASNGATITSYTVTSSPGGVTATGTASPIVVGNLANGTSYTFTVTATNSAGTSPPSSPSNAVTPTTPASSGNSGSSGSTGSSSSSSSSSGSSSSSSSSTTVPSLTVVSTKLTVTGHTKTTVTLACAAATCKGTASLTTKIVTTRHKGKKVIHTTKTRVFGTVSFTISAGKHATETIHLNAAGKAAFGRASKSKPLHTTLTTTVKGGKTRATRVTLI